jgi:glutathione S-transferase
VVALKYWNGRGLMDTPRMMMAIAGKSYKDMRMLDVDDFPNAKGLVNPKDMGDMDANLGRLPIVETTRGAVGQSAAINFLVASQCGLMGADVFEAAEIISFTEHLKELSASYRKLVPYGSQPSTNALVKFFESAEASDYSGPADSTKIDQRFLRWYLGRLERRLPGNGFCVGGRLSLADVALFDVFANELSEATANPLVPQYRREAFGSHDRVERALAIHPKVKAVLAGVGKHPGLQAWRASRGPQEF